MKISILLAAYNSKDLLHKVFIPSLKNTICDYELIIRDNGGNGDLLKDISSKNIKILQNPIPTGNKNQDFIDLITDTMSKKLNLNVGLNTALNEAAKIATGDYFYLPHTDMCLMPGWDTALLQAAKNQAPKSFLFCSRSIEKSSHIPMQLIKDFGTSLGDFKEKELYDFFSQYSDKGIVSGYRMPFFMHRQLWEAMGGVDEQFFSYATDNDLFFSAYDKGVRKFWMVNSSVVYHLSGHSNKQQTVDKDDRTPYIRLCEKWKKYNVNMNIDQSEQALVPWNLKIR